MTTERYMVSGLPPIGSSQAQQFSPRAVARYDGLTGPKYTLKDGPIKHRLPPSSVLKPYQDTKAGGLETWPAHASGAGNATTSIQLNKNRQLILIDDEASKKPHSVPKPKFLDQLESFLKKELRSLGVADVTPNELRLQAHREVFEYLIEDFKTYKPLLSAIKNEYEMMLAHQSQRIRELEPLKQMLVTVAEQCDQKIVALRDQEKQDIKDLQTENQRLHGRIAAEQEAQVSLQVQVERLKEELGVEYHKYRDECDARKLLIADINDLRYQQEDALVAKQSMLDAEENKEDPVTLKIALKRAREDEAAASKRLSEMVANYGDVIPRRDFEALQKQYQQLEDKVGEMKGDYQKLKDEQETLMGTYKQVLQERDDYFYEYESLRNKALTPRPDWEQCADHVPGGITRWKALSEGKKSSELVQLLLTEMVGGGGADSSPAENFDGLGAGEEVPAYLRHEGQVRNRHLAKRDCALFIKDVWKDKVDSDKERPEESRQTVSDFLYDYLKRRFALDSLVVEWGYNLQDACKRFSHDERMETFLNALTGEGDEDLYHVPLEIISKLLNHLSQLDAEKGNSGQLSKEDFKEALQEFFSGPSYWFLGKDADSLSQLARAAETELDARAQDALEYKNLFLEDDEGHTGAFLEEFRKQMRQERNEYVDSIGHAIGDVTPVPADDLQKAVTMVDSYIKKGDLDSYLCWVYQVSSREELEAADPVPRDKVMARLLHGNVRKHSQFET